MGEGTGGWKEGRKVDGGRVGRCMGGWKEGWVEGWVDGWVDGRKESGWWKGG